MVERAITYVKVAPFQHAYGIYSGFMTVFATLGAAESSDIESFYTYTTGGIIGLLGMAASVFESNAQLHRYDRVRKELNKRGWDERFLKNQTNWWCHRHAARLAAQDSGYKEEMDTFLESNGFHWHDIYR